MKLYTLEEAQKYEYWKRAERLEPILEKQWEDLMNKIDFSKHILSYEEWLKRYPERKK